MTLMAVGKTPDLWAAAVELFGIINWFTMLKSSGYKVIDGLHGTTGQKSG
jgi:dipeptidyl aminopeptidase/acylaminoacyl peptidase